MLGTQWSLSKFLLNELIKEQTKQIVYMVICLLSVFIFEAEYQVI